MMSAKKTKNIDEAQSFSLKRKTVTALVAILAVIIISGFYFVIYSKILDQITNLKKSPVNLEQNKEEEKEEEKEEGKTGIPTCTFEEFLEKGKAEYYDDINRIDYKIESIAEKKTTTDDIETPPEESTVYKYWLNLLTSKGYYEDTPEKVICKTDITKRYLNILKKFDKRDEFSFDNAYSEFDNKHPIEDSPWEYLQIIDYTQLVRVDIVNETIKPIMETDKNARAPIFINIVGEWQGLDRASKEILFTAQDDRYSCDGLIEPGSQVEKECDKARIEELRTICKENIDGLWSYNPETGKKTKISSPSCLVLNKLLKGVK